MSEQPRANALGQPIGPPVPGWSPRPRPPRTPMVGRHVRLEPLEAARHAADLFAAFAAEPSGRHFTYLSVEPFDDAGALAAWIETSCRGDDPLFHAIVERTTGRALGVAAFLRIDPAAGSIEVGHINLAPALQRTAGATEAMYLMMGRAFDELGYRRYEWKCDALNAPSRRAALRLGFTYEGIFRQATVYKGRNRDTAWYAIIDREWPALAAAHARWLDPANFDPAGRQRESLSALTRDALAARASTTP